MGPVLAVSERQYDFGTVGHDSLLRHDFTLKNAGDETLHIMSIKTSTGADMGWVTKHAIDPGDTCHMHYVADFRQSKEGRFGKHITIESNDLSHSPTTILVTFQMSPAPVPDEDIEWQCRSELLESQIERGYVGRFEGQKIFFELWDVPGSTGTSSDYLILLTDTMWDDGFDLCLPDAEQPLEARLSRPRVQRLDSNDMYEPDWHLFEWDIPHVFQVLVDGEYGYQVYTGLNKSKDQRIYIKGNSLYIEHWDAPRYDDSRLVLDRYQFRGSARKFKLTSSRELKREPWY